MSPTTAVGHQEISNYPLGWLLVILFATAFGTPLLGGLVFDDRFLVLDNHLAAYAALQQAENDITGKPWRMISSI